MTRQSNRRHGSLLVELMVVLPIFATLLVLTVGWIHQAMNLASTIEKRQRQHRQLLVLARQFRDDVHQGREVRIEAEDRLVIALDDDAEVVYELSGRRITRSAGDSRDSGRRESNRGGREFYELADGSRAFWDRSGLPEWAGLVIERPHGRVGRAVPPPESAAAPAATAPEPARAVADLHVRAAVGRWPSWNTWSPARGATTPARGATTEGESPEDAGPASDPQSETGLDPETAPEEI